MSKVLLLSLVLLGSCCLPLDRTQFWKRHGNEVLISDVSANLERGNVTAITLYWHPSSQQDGKVIWKVDAEEPVQFSGFEFKVFETPEGFIPKKNDLTMPDSGIYVLKVEGDKIGYNTLLHLELKPKEVLAWRKPAH